MKFFVSRLSEVGRARECKNSREYLGEVAERNGAYREIAIIVAWVYDTISIMDCIVYRCHYMNGAEIAYRILERYNYGDKKLY